MSGFYRDFRENPSIDDLATRYAWSRSTIINKEHQFYINPNWNGWSPFSFDDRGLAITAQQTPPEHAETGMPYVSGVITSNGPTVFRQRYGTWVVRATLPDARGAFVAPLWLLPMDWRWLKAEHSDEGVLPEIDVCENVGEAREGVYHVTVHTRGAGGAKLVAHSQRIETGVDLTAGPNDYGLKWCQRWLIFTFNGEEVWRFETPRDMHDMRHFLCNFAVGGDWAGPPDPADYPASMYIESITVAPLDDSAVPADILEYHAELEVRAQAIDAKRQDELVDIAREALLKYGRWLASDAAASAHEGVDPEAMLLAIADIESRYA